MWNCGLIDTPGGEGVELWAYRYTRGWVWNCGLIDTPGGEGVELLAYRYTRGGGCGTVGL